jgi:hypothetical protein
MDPFVVRKWNGFDASQGSRCIMCCRISLRDGVDDVVVKHNGFMPSNMLMMIWAAFLLWLLLLLMSMLFLSFGGKEGSRFFKKGQSYLFPGRFILRFLDKSNIHVF